MTRLAPACHARPMLTHLAVPQHLQAPLIACAVALGLALMARFLRANVLATAAGGAAVIAGWFLLTGVLRVDRAGPSIEELPAFALIALLVGLICGWLGTNRLAWLAPLLPAVAAAWLFSGAPSHLTALRSNWPIDLGVAAVVWVFTRTYAPAALDPARLAMGGLTLAAALSVAEAPGIWTHLALVPGLAGLALLAVPQGSGSAGLPVAADIGAAACLAALTHGRLSRLGFAPIDAAAVSPLLAAWVQPRAAQRLHKLGRVATAAGALLAGLIAVGCVWLVRQAIGR